MLKFAKALPENKRLQILDAVELIIERHRAGELMTSVTIPPRFGKSSVIRISALELFPEIGMPSVMAAPWTDNVDQIRDKEKVLEMFAQYGIKTGTCKFEYHRCRKLKTNSWWQLSESTPTFITCTLGLINHASNQSQFLDGISDMHSRCGKRIMVLIDEAHLVKDHKKLGQLIRNIIESGGYVVLLTGTPVPGIPGFQQQCKEWQEVLRHVYARRFVDGEEKHFIDHYEGAGRDVDSIKADFNVTWEEAFSVGALSKANAVWVDLDVNDEGEALGPLSGIAPAELNGRLKSIMESDELMSRMVDAGLRRLQLKRARSATAAARMLVVTGRDTYFGKEDRSEEANRHAKKYATLLREAADSLGMRNLRIEIATGVDKDGDPDPQAAQRIKDFRKGKIDVLMVKSMGIVGLDVPEIKVQIFGSTLREGPMAIQALSRALTTWRCRADLVMPRDAKMIQLYDRVIKDKGGEWRETDLKLIGSDEIEPEPRTLWTFANGRVGAYSDEKGSLREGEYEFVLSLIKTKYNTNGLSDLQIIENFEMGGFPISDDDKRAARDEEHRADDFGVADLDAGLDSKEGQFGAKAKEIVTRYIHYSNRELWVEKLRELQQIAKQMCGVENRKVKDIDDVALLTRLIEALGPAELRVFGHGRSEAV